MKSRTCSCCTCSWFSIINFKGTKNWISVELIMGQIATVKRLLYEASITTHSTS